MLLLGTDGADGAWHLENIPHLTSKPGEIGTEYFFR